jgi:predicted Zn-dependent protease with MMP-like domain
MIDYVDNRVFCIPCLKQIKEYAATALYCCPAKVQNTLRVTRIVVENFASKDVLDELCVKNKNELLGLYKMHSNSNEKDLILFRGALVLYSKLSKKSISSVVARVTVYEISHRANCVSLRKLWLEQIRKL